MDTLQLKDIKYKDALMLTSDHLMQICKFKRIEAITHSDFKVSLLGAIHYADIVIYVADDCKTKILKKRY